MPAMRFRESVAVLSPTFEAHRSRGQPLDPTTEGTNGATDGLTHAIVEPPENPNDDTNLTTNPTSHSN